MCCSNFVINFDLKNIECFFKVRERNKNEDPLYDTLLIPKRHDTKEAVLDRVNWKFDLPKKADYKVVLTLGDAKFGGHFSGCELNDFDPGVGNKIRH